MTRCRNSIQRNLKPVIILSSLLILSTFLAGCVSPETSTPQSPTQTSSPGSGGSSPERANIRIVVVTHGVATSRFWPIVRQGVEQAAKDMGVQVEYQSPEVFDIIEMKQMIDDAVATHPDGLVVSLPDPEVLGPSIKAAVAAGIPVISINSGSEAAQDLGVLAHVGQTEYEAGYGAGQQLGAKGVTFALCVNQEIGNIGLDQRCDGLADGLGETGGVIEVVGIDLADPVEVQAEGISTALSHNPNVDGILTLNRDAAGVALQVLQDEQLLDRVTLATFDYSPPILEGIKNGQITFAIDQQPYLQGYLPIVYLTLYLTNANTPGDKLILTGPSYVTMENVDEILQLSEAGTR